MSGWDDRDGAMSYTIMMHEVIFDCIQFLCLLFLNLSQLVSSSIDLLWLNNYEKNGWGIWANLQTRASDQGLSN